MNEVKVNIKKLGTKHPGNGMIAVFANREVVSNIKRVGHKLIVTTTLEDKDNLVLYLDGWLYQSNPKKSDNNRKLLKWQMMPLDGVSHKLVTPESWRSWSV